MKPIIPAANVGIAGVRAYLDALTKDFRPIEKEMKKDAKRGVECLSGKRKKGKRLSDFHRFMRALPVLRAALKTAHREVQFYLNAAEEYGGRPIDPAIESELEKAIEEVEGLIREKPLSAKRRAGVPSTSDDVKELREQAVARLVKKFGFRNERSARHFVNNAFREKGLLNRTKP